MTALQNYRDQIENSTPQPNFRNVIADAYKEPVIEPITQEGQQLESQYLPTVFDTFANMGTGAGDMSAAAKLQMIGRNLGQLGSRINQNRSVQNFYNTQIQDLANLENQRAQQEQGRMQNLWNMTFQENQAQKQAGQEAARLAFQRESLQKSMDMDRERLGQTLAAQDLQQRRELESRQNQAKSLQALMEKYSQPQVTQISEQTPEQAQIQVDPRSFTDVGQLNAYRSSVGLSPLSEDYFENTYKEKPTVEAQGSDYGLERINAAWRNPDGTFKMGSDPFKGILGPIPGMVNSENFGEKLFSIAAAPGVGFGALTGWY